MFLHATCSTVRFCCTVISAAGGQWEAYTTFCSSSGKSPAKCLVASGNNHILLSVTSKWLNISVGYSPGRSWAVYPASWAIAAK